MTDYTHYLLSYLPPLKLHTHSYGHVIPPQNLTARPLCRGLAGTEFDFTYLRRDSEPLILDLGRTVAALCAVIPDGVVAFFPSYDYLRRVLGVWTKPIGGRPSVLAAIETEAGKRVFCEPAAAAESTAESAADSATLLQRYAEAVRGQGQGNDQDGRSCGRGHGHGHGRGRGWRGAFLVAVMGGSLSEGINFADSLGRAVLVVGLPFPNARSVIWQARLEHVEARVRARVQNSAPVAAAGATGGGGGGEGGGEGGEAKPGTKTETETEIAAPPSGPPLTPSQASRDYYENACMRTVNQCIGRAIRHAGDYAAIVLLDRRYGGARVQAKLPGWIRGRIVPEGEGEGERKAEEMGIGQGQAARVVREVGVFFRGR